MNLKNRNMVLYKLDDFDPNYRSSFCGDEIKGYDVQPFTLIFEVSQVEEVRREDPTKPASKPLP